MNKNILIALGLAVGVSTNAQLFTTDFNSPTYSDGNLVGQDGWANHSGTGSFIQVSDTATDGFITLAMGSGSREDANIGLGDVMGAGDIWSASFDVTVLSGATNVYFAHFKDSGTGFNGRVFAAAPVAGGDFTFGISDTSSSVDATFAVDFDFGVTYRPTVTYNFDTGLSTLEIGALTISSTTADAGQPMEAFAFRQAGGSFAIEVDNLTVNAIPEPSAFVAVLGLLGFVGLRRRRA